MCRSVFVLMICFLPSQAPQQLEQGARCRCNPCPASLPLQYCGDCGTYYTSHKRSYYYYRPYHLYTHSAPTVRARIPFVPWNGFSVHTPSRDTIYTYVRTDRLGISLSTPAWMDHRGKPNTNPHVVRSDRLAHIDVRIQSSVLFSYRRLRLQSYFYLLLIAMIAIMCIVIAAAMHIDTAIHACMQMELSTAHNSMKFEFSRSASQPHVSGGVTLMPLVLVNV